MKRPLLGIIIVICLQLSFTAFNAIDRSMGSLFAVNALTRGTNPLVDILDEGEVAGLSENFRSPGRPRNPDRGVTPSNWRRGARGIETSETIGKRSSNIAEAKKFKRMPQYVAQQRPFESTVITYPRVIMAAAESEVQPVPIPTEIVVASEKRSFASKSAAILKKPYNWLKALGSKFN